MIAPFGKSETYRASEVPDLSLLESLVASGDIQARKILQDYGLEWLFRLVNEPKRLWRRYLILNPLFVLTFSRQLIKSKIDKTVAYEPLPASKH